MAFAMYRSLRAVYQGTADQPARRGMRLFHDRASRQEKPVHQGGDQISFLIQREVSGVQEMNFGVRHFAPERQGAGNGKERIIIHS